MRYFIIIILSASLGAVFAMMDWPIWMLYTLIGVIIIISISSLIYTVAFSTNMEKIKKYLNKNKKNEIYYYAHILPTATDYDLIEALQKIVAKYKNSKYEAIYGAYLALLQDDTYKAKQYISIIKHTEIGRYTQALIDVYEGNYDEAANANIQKRWMSEGILTYIAFFQKDVAAFNKHRDNAIEHARGVQRYVNIHTFARLEHELKAT